MSLNSLIRAGDLNKVAQLINDHPEFVKTEDSNGWYPIHHAVAYGHLDIIRFIAQANPSYLDVLNSEDESAAFFALKNPTYKLQPHLIEAILRLLFELGSNFVHRVNTDGSTVLHFAACTERGRYVRTLIEFGATSFYHENSLGYTPIGMAIDDGYLDAARAMLEKSDRASLNHCDEHGRSLLLRAVHSTPSMLKLVAEFTSDFLLEKRDHLGQTPLEVAFMHGYYQMAGILLNLGAEEPKDLDSRDLSRALDYVLEEQNREERLYRLKTPSPSSSSSDEEDDDEPTPRRTRQRTN